MSKNKLAIPRLTHFVTMLKENRYPNHPTLVREMQMLDIAGAYSIAQKTLQANLTFQKELSSLGDYFWRKNGDKILKSLEIKEIKVNGNWAVAFYKLSLGATEVKKTMMLYKVNDGYWMEISTYTAKKKCPENWFRDMNEKMERFQKDSGEFDILDI